MKKYIELIRAKHWLKNILIFLPAFFSMNILKLEYIETLMIAFFVFCFTSSIVYILNDMSDIEKDKLHPIKKNRPLASGRVSKTNAWIVMILLVVISIILSFILYQKNSVLGIWIIPIVYIILNILYSKGLKNIPIIDVVILASGFVLRVMYGGVTINVEVSKYLYLMIIFGAFYLGFGKRRNEMMKNGEKGREVLKRYNQDFLDKNMYIAFALAIVAYTLWCVDSTTIAHVGNDYLFWTIPILIIILQLYSLDIEGNSHGDPIEVILSDKILLGTGVLYGIIMAIILYL